VLECFTWDQPLRRCTLDVISSERLRRCCHAYSFAGWSLPSSSFVHFVFPAVLLSPSLLSFHLPPPSRKQPPFFVTSAWFILWYYSGISLEGLRNSTKNLGQERRVADGDQFPRPKREADTATCSLCDAPCKS
jgi:hypothetical protein